MLGYPTPTLYAFGGWRSCSQTPIASGGWGIRPPDPATPSPHRRFLATRLHEQKFTARYCRPPFVGLLAFSLKYAWNVWRRCSHSQTMYCILRPKVFHLIILIQKNYLKKSFHLHQSHFGFGREEVCFFFLNIAHSCNKF